MKSSSYPRNQDFWQKIGSFGKKWGLFQKIGTFAFSPNRAFPKNRDFDRNSLHMRVPILSKPVYIIYDAATGGPDSGIDRCLKIKAYEFMFQHNK